MKVTLLFFAILRDIVGRSEVDLEVPEGSTAEDLWHSMTRDHERLREFARPPLTAINQCYVPPTTALTDGDEVAFIPPVSGG